MPNKEQDSVDLPTAANILGLTVETVRKRLQRKKLQGFKAADGKWRVILDNGLDKQAKPGRSGWPGQSVGQDQDRARRSAGHEQDKAGQPARQDHSALVATLQDEILFLRRQLLARDDEIQRRDEEIRRVHVLLQQLQRQQQQQVKALTDSSQAQAWLQGWMKLWFWWLQLSD